jgi:hypothetical protein
MEDILAIPREIVQRAHDALEQIEDWSDPSSETFILYHQLQTFLYPEPQDIRRGSARGVTVLPVVRVER